MGMTSTATECGKLLLTVEIRLKNNASVSVLAGEEQTSFCLFNMYSQIPSKAVFHFGSFVRRPNYPTVSISVRDRAL